MPRQEPKLPSRKLWELSKQHEKEDIYAYNESISQASASTVKGPQEDFRNQRFAPEKGRVSGSSDSDAQEAELCFAKDCPGAIDGRQGSYGVYTGY